MYAIYAHQIPIIFPLYYTTVFGTKYEIQQLCSHYSQIMVSNDVVYRHFQTEA